MPAEKTTGIVLKVVDFSETSCVVTLYTRDFGKITALAKGARRLRSPFEGAIDLLASCRLVFLRKSVDKLDLLTEAKLLRRFKSASVDLARLYVGMYIIEIVSLMTDPYEPEPDLFDLLQNTIEAIDRPEDGSELAVQLLRFEWQLLKLLGHQPSLVDCVGCGNSIEQELESRRRVAFGMLAGGVFCNSCRPGKRSVVGLKVEAWKLLRQLADQALLEVPYSQAEGGELRGLLDQYIADLVGFRPRMQSWLKEAFKT